MLGRRLRDLTEQISLGINMGTLGYLAGVDRQGIDRLSNGFWRGIISLSAA